VWNNQNLLSRSKSISLLREILAVLPTGDKVKIWIVVGVQIFLSFLDLAGIAVIGVLGALAVTGIESSAPGNRVSAVLRFLQLSNYSFQTQVIILGLTATVLLVVRTLSSIFLTKRILLFMSRRAALITSQLVTNLFSRSILDLQKYSQQQVLYSVTTGVQNLTLGVIGTGITAISDFSLLLVLAVGLLVVDPWMAISIIFSFTIIGYCLYRYMKHRSFVIGCDEVEFGISSNQKIIEFLDTYREAIIKNRRKSYIDEISKLRYKLADVVAEKAFMPNISKYMVEVTVVIGSIVIGAIQFSLQGATHAVASLSVFLAAGTRIAPAVLRIQQGAVTIRNSLGSSVATLGMIHEYQEFSKDFDEPVNPDFMYKDFHSQVVLDSVSFTYSEKSKSALSNIDLAINPGEILAIVGPSGAGKSTLVDILLGIFPPDEGTVRISNENPLDAFGKWPGAISYVPQNISIAMGSIKENIALGLNPTDFSDDLYWAALKRAQLDDFVKALPEGLDTFVGDQGSKFSGGQKQRLGIARALFTKPKLLVLDEATSALDVETEAAIADVIQSLSGHTTVITIAHRLSSVRNSDRIIYLDNGELIAEGTFEELRARVQDFDRQAGLMGL